MTEKILTEKDILKKEIQELQQCLRTAWQRIAVLSGYTREGMMLIKEYSDKQPNGRRAQVYVENGDYVVVLINDCAVMDERKIKNHSEVFAKAVAKNYVEG